YDDVAVLVGADGVENGAVLLRNELGDGDGGGYGVAEEHRLGEAELLAHVYGAGAGQLRAENGGDETGGEHAVGYPLAEHALLGLDLVDVGGVEVAADAGVGVYVVLGDG